MSDRHIEDGYNQNNTIYIDLLSGLAVDLFNPNYEDILVEDIATSLSKQCRYNGNINRFYTVAEHCSHIYDSMKANEVPAIVCALGLVHDAPEYILGDQPTPLKRHMFIVRPGGTEVMKFRDLEDNIFKAIEKSIYPGFKFLTSHWKIVKKYDEKALSDEWHVLRPNTEYRGTVDMSQKDQLGIEIQCWEPERAKKEWLDRVRESQKILNDN